MKNFYSDPEAVKRYIDGRDGGGSRNQVVEERAFLQLLEDPDGLYCLDVGCGYGYYCRLMAERGARVLGVDKSELMIKEAISRSASHDIRYVVGEMEEFVFPSETFNLIISNLAFHYVYDIETLFRRTYSWLKKGGTFIFTIEHPILTANLLQEEPQWVDNNNHVGWIVSDYFHSGERMGFFGLKYHKTLEEYFNAVTDAGYQVLKILEPAPDPVAVQTRTDLQEDLHRPLFIAFKCKKGFT